MLFPRVNHVCIRVIPYPPLFMTCLFNILCLLYTLKCSMYHSSYSLSRQQRDYDRGCLLSELLDPFVQNFVRTFLEIDSREKRWMGNHFLDCIESSSSCNSWCTPWHGKKMSFFFTACVLVSQDSWGTFLVITLFSGFSSQVFKAREYLNPIFFTKKSRIQKCSCLLDYHTVRLFRL